MSLGLRIIDMKNTLAAEVILDIRSMSFTCGGLPYIYMVLTVH